jgi:hypothetical protein
MTDHATPPTPSPSTSDLQAAAAAAVGLDPKFAPRLQGAGLAEMVADARAFSEQIAPPAAAPVAPAEATPEQPPAAAVVAPTLTAADGVTGGPERREQPGMALDAMRQLAKSRPAEWNRRAEAGEFDHLLGWGKAR